jgi:hypothetical protein
MGAMLSERALLIWWQQQPVLQQANAPSRKCSRPCIQQLRLRASFTPDTTTSNALLTQTLTVCASTQLHPPPPRPASPPVSPSRTHVYFMCACPSTHSITCCISLLLRCTAAPFWGHVVSKDLAHWTWLPPALLPDTMYDFNGVWSGAATMADGDVPVLTFTGTLHGITHRRSVGHGTATHMYSIAHGSSHVHRYTARRRVVQHHIMLVLVMLLSHGFT